MKKILVLCCTFFVLACSETKKLNKAIGKVMSNKGAVDSIGRHWERSHPCANDTTFTEKTDTVSQPIFIYCDSNGVAHINPTDTVGHIQYVRQIITKVKTEVVVDHRRESLLQDDLNKCSAENLQKSSTIDGLTKANALLAKNMADAARKENWKIWKNRLIFSAPWILALLGFLFRSSIPFLKFKN